MTALEDIDWSGGDLEAARRPKSLEQDRWDARWRRAYNAAIRAGRTPNDAAVIATNRTETAHGLRPGTAEETNQ